MAVKRQQRTQTTRDELIQRAAHQYMQETDTAECVDLNALTEWYMGQGLWQESKLSEFKRCKQAITKALTHETFTDERGNHVRRMHAVRRKDADGQMYWEWADIHAAKPEHMRISLSQRRRYIAGRVRQHDVDREYYNDHNKFGAELLPYDYNFNRDREEEKLAALHGDGYPDEKPDD